MSNDGILEKARIFEKNLLNFFWRLGVSYSEGEDLLQETYLRLWKYRDQYEETAKLSTFLFTIARQVRIDAFRRESRRGRREEVWMKEQPSKAGSRLPLREDVRWAVSKLPEAMRETVELAIFQELPYAEVGKILSIPVGTVKSRISNALKKLKEIFDDERS